jgi:hypothetical protein
MGINKKVDNKCAFVLSIPLQDHKRNAAIIGRITEIKWDSAKNRTKLSKVPLK